MTATTVAFLLLLARLLATDPAVCDAARAAIRASAAQPQPYFGDSPLHDAALVGEALIVATGAGRERTLIRSTRRGDDTLQSLTLRGGRSHEEIVVRGARWWYGGTVDHEGAPATELLSDDGSGAVAMTTVPMRGRGPYLFLPLRGEQPRGLQISAEESGGTLLVEVDATHALRSWHLPPMNLMNARIAAEPLPDGRIAFFTVRAPRFELVILRDQEQFATATLREAEPFQFATAVDPAGRIGIVTVTVAPGGEEVEGAVLDVDHAAAAAWHLLSRDARLAAWPAMELRLAAAAHGFVAAWVDRAQRRRLTLQACDLTPASEPTVADIGEPVEGRLFGAFFAMQPSGDDLLFFWDDGRHIVMRRLTGSIAQIAATQRTAALCEGPR
jgi:hypothetical protein